MKKVSSSDADKINKTQGLRVLISTVCAVVLCLGCLVSVTWAWYSTEINSRANVLQIDSWHTPGTVEETQQETTEVTTEVTESAETTEETVSQTIEETTEETIEETTEETVDQTADENN